jgi:N-acetyltransferase
MTKPEFKGQFVYLEPLHENHREVLRGMAKDERIWEFTKTLLLNESYDAQFDEYFDVALGFVQSGWQAYVIRAVPGAAGVREPKAAGHGGMAGEAGANGESGKTGGGGANGDDGRIIGMTRLFHVEPKDKRLEIGHTWYLPEVWGKVYNKECKLLLLQYVFETLGFNRVEFRVAHQNIRSQKAVEKIGGVKEGVLRKFAIRNDGSRRDTVVFSIIDEEWPEKKKRLQQMVAEAI